MKTTLKIAVALALGSLLFPAGAQTKQSLKNQRLNLRLGVRSVNLPLSVSSSAQTAGDSRPSATSNSKQFVFDGVPIIHNGCEKWKNAVVTVLTYMKENDPDAYKAHKKYVRDISYLENHTKGAPAWAWAKPYRGKPANIWCMDKRMLKYFKGDGTSIGDIGDYFFALVYHETQHCDVSDFDAKRPAKSYEEPAACWASYHYLIRAKRSPSAANFYKGLAMAKGFRKEMWDAYKKDLD